MAEVTTDIITDIDALLSGDLSGPEQVRAVLREARDALAAMGEREAPQPLALNDPEDDEAARWVMAKLHGIRRDSGTIEYTLAAVIRAYQAGKASVASPRPEAVDEAVKAERERCARIAEADRRGELAKQCGYEPAFHTVGKVIAAAIRATEEPPAPTPLTPSIPDQR